MNRVPRPAPQRRPGKVAIVFAIGVLIGLTARRLTAVAPSGPTAWEPLPAPTPRPAPLPPPAPEPDGEGEGRPRPAARKRRALRAVRGSASRGARRAALSAVATVTAIVVVAAVLWIALAAAGWRVAAIRGSNVSPFADGTLLLVAPTESEDVAVGDDVVFDSGPRVAAHRIVEVMNNPSGQAFLAQVPGMPAGHVERVGEDAVVGSVRASVPIAGQIAAAVTRTRLLTLLGLACVAGVLREAAHAIRAVRRHRLKAPEPWLADALTIP